MIKEDYYFLMKMKKTMEKKIIKIITVLKEEKQIKKGEKGWKKCCQKLSQICIMLQHVPLHTDVSVDLSMF